MILVTDSGATKADWRLVRKDGTPVERLLTEGMNVSSMATDTVLGIVRKAAEAFRQYGGNISEVHFYTAGVVTEQIRHSLTAALKEIATEAEPEIWDDLTGCARAVCGHAPGIAAILGSGSNSCQFDGTAITAHVNTGGFILGDEGSASALGKIFVSDLIKGLVPGEIADAFAKDHDSSYAGIVQKVYRSAGSPSGYLGSLAPFILEHYSHPYIKAMVDGNFRSFIDRCLRRYEVDKYPAGIVGGFGCACRHIFGPLAEEAGIKVSGYISEPVEGLIKYHTC